jgi:hypothetical protein
MTSRVDVSSIEGPSEARIAGVRPSITAALAMLNFIHSDV